MYSELTERFTRLLIDAFNHEDNNFKDPHQAFVRVSCDMGGQLYKELAEIEGLDLETINKVHKLDNRFVDVGSQVFADAVVEHQQNYVGDNQVDAYSVIASGLACKDFVFSAYRKFDLDVNLDTGAPDEIPREMVLGQVVEKHRISRDWSIIEEANTKLEALYQAGLESVESNDAPLDSSSH